MDKLTELYEAWEKAQAGGIKLPFNAFQAGMTAGAVSMRNRAVAAAQAAKTPDNDLVNAIGSLSDIPT